MEICKYLTRGVWSYGGQDVVIWSLNGAAVNRAATDTTSPVLLCFSASVLQCPSAQLLQCSSAPVLQCSIPVACIHIPRSVNILKRGHNIGNLTFHSTLK